MRQQRPIGAVTRGTTHPNRLRRVDRWILHSQRRQLHDEPDPLVVDLGFGAHPSTTVELAQRLRQGLAPAVSGLRVMGLDLDSQRVARARAVAPQGVSFAVGGFEIPVVGRVSVLRAFNVLRQYDAGEVGSAWAQMQSRLTPRGVLVEGTCDELGRLSSWVCLGRHQPLSLTISMSLRHLHRPSDLAARLPKVLIHDNVPGQPIHAFLASLDAAWLRHAPLATFGARQRFVASARTLRDEGWPIIGSAARWRLGELSVDWAAVAPRA